MRACVRVPPPLLVVTLGARRQLEPREVHRGIESGMESRSQMCGDGVLIGLLGEAPDCLSKKRSRLEDVRTGPWWAGGRVEKGQRQ